MPTRAAWLKRSVERLTELRKQYQGRTFLVLGNGPSLDKVERSHLDACVSIGTNNAWRIAPRIGRYTDLLLITDRNRVLEFQRAAPDLDSLVFIGDHDDVVPSVRRYRSLHDRGAFCLRQLVIPSLRRSLVLLNVAKLNRRILSRVVEKKTPSFEPLDGFNFGYSVVVPAIQVAVALGASRVLLCGVDATSSQKSYFANMPTNVRVDPTFLQNPRLTMEPHLALLRAALDPLNIPLLDCSPGGALTSLQKAELHEVAR